MTWKATTYSSVGDKALNLKIVKQDSCSMDLINLRGTNLTIENVSWLAPSTCDPENIKHLYLSCFEISQITYNNNSRLAYSMYFQISNHFLVHALKIFV